MKRIPQPLEFEWDEGNKDKNFIKHKVNNKEAEEIFFNKPFQVFPDPKHSDKEQRFVAFGNTNKGRLLTVVFTVRNNKIRVISARNQSSKERSKYAKT